MLTAVNNGPHLLCSSLTSLGLQVGHRDMQGGQQAFFKEPPTLDMQCLTCSPGRNEGW